MKGLWKALVMLAVVIGLFVMYEYFNSREMITSVNRYERILGAGGKYKENYDRYNDIFPDKIPGGADVEEFRYFYYNPWDANYMGYLVYTCDKETFEAERARLKALESTERQLIYGAEAFPYELCAVYARDYGYIYALADEEACRLIYVELQFANSFTDIEYEKYIDAKYLPIGFDAKMEEKVMYDDFNSN